MNFKELKDQTQHALAAILHRRGKSEFWHFHFQLHELHRKYFSEAKKEDLAPAQFQKYHNNFINDVKAVIQNTDLGRVFVSLNEYRESIKEAIWQTPLVKSGADGLNEEFEELWKQLSDLMRNSESFPLIIAILGRCENLSEKLQYFDNCYRFLSEAEELLDDKQEIPDNQAGLELEFSLEIETLADLNFRLNSLQVVYSEACLIFGVNESTFPLKLSKVETGSLWTKTFGESKVIDFVIWFLKNSILFLHRNYTREGKLERIPVDVNVLNEQLGLLSKLKELLPEERYKALIETQSDTLAKASCIIAKHTQNLLEREASLKIDGEIIKLDYPHETKYLEAVKKQLPERSSFIVVDPESVQPPSKALPDKKINPKETSSNG